MNRYCSTRQTLVLVQIETNGFSQGCFWEYFVVYVVVKESKEQEFEMCGAVVNFDALGSPLAVNSVTYHQINQG